MTKMPARRATSAKNSKILGKDANGRPVYVGDTVDHVKKPNRTGGWVTGQCTVYRNEPVTIVKYPSGDHLNRLSQLVVTQKNATPAAVEKALQSVLDERIALKQAVQAKKEKEFLKDCPRDEAPRHRTGKQWGLSNEVSGGLPSLGKKR